MISEELLRQAREESETGNEQYSRGFISEVITELLTARKKLYEYEAAKAEADFDANYRRAAQGKDVGGVGRQVDKQVIEAAKASERPESPKRIVRKDGEIIGIEPNPYHQPVECAGAFQKDYSAYVKQWSDGECPVTAAERDAYAAGWKDAWQHKRESGWLPMEAAPRDRTRILITDGLGVSIAWFGHGNTTYENPTWNKDDGTRIFEEHLQPRGWQRLPLSKIEDQQ